MARACGASMQNVRPVPGWRIAAYFIAGAQITGIGQTWSVLLDRIHADRRKVMSVVDDR